MEHPWKTNNPQPVCKFFKGDYNSHNSKSDFDACCFADSDKRLFYSFISLSTMAHTQESDQTFSAVSIMSIMV